jgi:hypothetical protein
LKVVASLGAADSVAAEPEGPMAVAFPTTLAIRFSVDLCFASDIGCPVSLESRSPTGEGSAGLGYETEVFTSRSIAAFCVIIFFVIFLGVLAEAPFD